MNYKESMTLQHQKIAVISSDILSTHSAEVIFLMEMCSSFSKKGFTTHLFVPKFTMSIEELFSYYNVEFPFSITQLDIPIRLPNKKISGRGLLFSISAAKRLNKMDFDYLYSRNPWFFFFLTVFYKSLCFLEIHQYRFEGKFQTLMYRLLVRLGMKQKKGFLICISTNLMDQWAQESIDKKRMVYEHDAVNFSKFCGKNSTVIPQNLKCISDDRKNVVYTGSLKPGKGVEVLVQCANLLPDIRFVIVGGKKDEIESLKKKSNFKNIVFTGHIQPKYIPLYQSRADILILPNTRGSFIDDVTSPMKLFEYMAVRKPIIATDIPSILEILKDNRNALICPTGNANIMAEKITHLLNNRILAEKLADCAFNDLKYYTWDARVERLINLFNYHAKNSLYCSSQ